MKKGTKIASIMGAIIGATLSKNSGVSFKDSKDVQDKNEGRENIPIFYGSNPQPIFIPSRSQKVKSKILAKRNSKR